MQCIKCGKYEYEYICDLNISKIICEKYIHDLFANNVQVENYSLKTVTKIYI